MSLRLISPVRLLLAALGVTALLTWLLARGLSLDSTHPVLAALVLALFAVTTLMLAASALTAVVGVFWRDRADANAGNPPGRCAVLWLVCGEPPEPLAARVAEFLTGLEVTAQSGGCDVFILSDTQGEAALAREQEALSGLMGRIRYRNRADPTGRKPGNLQDWIAAQGAAYEAFLILDADSGFSAVRLAAMRARMAANPRLALVQAAIRLRPAQSRFGVMQRLSSRLSGPVFARGLSRLSGDAGNFWGHNALIRVHAFAEISPLRDLRGRAPFGGPVLSHDFIEAAFLRRRGWQVEICPDSRGSFEDAPETLAAHLRRDRRWAQGNLQHLRLIALPGLHLTSRLHLAAGIMSYLMAPLWLLMVLIIGSGAVHASAGVLWPLLGVLALLLAPKIAGVLARPKALARAARRRVLLRALWGELCLPTVFAPIGMFRRSGFVAAVLAGHNAGWVPSGQPMTEHGARGRAEVMGGLAIILAVALPQWASAGAGPAALAGVLVLPVVLPLLLA
ncbi:MAG: glucans biosynthesis glucosyltransferase MdoH, partial [Roseinatronobacter sp.]|nr:glucans biosynthesis glucosyltransferase MdoH [Roseinatronobacter sp.]